MGVCAGKTEKLGPDRVDLPIRQIELDSWAGGVFQTVSLHRDGFRMGCSALKMRKSAAFKLKPLKNTDH
jgi:hypothetical protein